MIRGKKIYDWMPVWVQGAAVNIASARNYRVKYGATFREQLARLEANERKPRAQLLAEQQTAIREMLTYARRHVPYYREMDCSPADLNLWPLLDKRVIAAAPEQFVSDEFPATNLMSLHTSGTTGTPLQVRFTAAYHQTEMAFRWRHKAWAGVPFLSRGAYIAGHPVVPARQQRPPFWRIDRFEKRLLCSSYHLAPRFLPDYIEALSRFKPDFIHGYPSSLHVLARHINTHGVKHLRPKALFSASETLLDFQREAIERAFGAKVYNWYGHTEMACNIVECEAGNLHYRTDYGHLELLEDGTMVCTGLNNRAMPLIRYRVGDVATAQEGGCACGREFPLISRVEGRIEDYVRTPDGRLVGRLDHLFKDARQVREAQIVQKQLNELVLRVVRERGFSRTDEQIIRREAQQRLGDSIQIKFEFVDAIERTASGKFRFMISELPREELQVASS